MQLPKNIWHTTVFLTTKMGGKRYTEFESIHWSHIKLGLKLKLKLDLKFDFKLNLVTINSALRIIMIV